MFATFCKIKPITFRSRSPPPAPSLLVRLQLQERILISGTLLYIFSIPGDLDERFFLLDDARFVSSGYSANRTSDAWLFPLSCPRDLRPTRVDPVCLSVTLENPVVVPMATSPTICNPLLTLHYQIFLSSPTSPFYPGLVQSAHRIPFLIQITLEQPPKTHSFVLPLFDTFFQAPIEKCVRLHLKLQWVPLPPPISLIASPSISQYDLIKRETIPDFSSCYDQSRPPPVSLLREVRVLVSPFWVFMEISPSTHSIGWDQPPPC